MFSPLIINYDELPSTNTEALRQATQGAREGVCIVAYSQTAGRGRMGRAWQSDDGAGLYFSLILRPSAPIEEWTLLSLLAAVAVHDALDEVYAVTADIKWSNDVLFNGKKLCGILCETTETTQGRACVVGIGINLRAQNWSAELEQTAISLAEIIGATPDRERFLQSLIRALQTRYAEWQQPAGANEIIAAWTARSTYARDKRVRVILPDGIICGTTRGVESDGALRVETDAGALHIIRAGDVNATLRARMDDEDDRDEAGDRVKKSKIESQNQISFN